MRPEPSLAIVGATGLVGREMISIIEQRNFPFCELKLLASENSKGELYSVAGEEYSVEVLDESSFDGVDLVLFATSSELSAKFVPIAVSAGAVCIDNSSFFRQHKEVPLVVPEVNINRVKTDTKIIANPNCCAAPLALVLAQFEAAAGIKRVVVSTYQSVSGAGKAALDELWSQSLALFNQSETIMAEFPHQIAFNAIPHIDTFLESGYTKEENKIIEETKKILDLSDLLITATSVRVPIFHAHALSVNLQLNRDLSPEDLMKRLEDSPGIELFAAHDCYPMHIGAAGGDSVQVGRIRRDITVPSGFDLWIVSDNLRKGAALNAVQIAEALLKL